MFAALANSALAHSLHRLAWLPQFLETIHMTFHALLVGAVVLLALRLLGFGRTIPLPMLTRYLLPACWVSLAALAATGGLMFVMAADKYVADGYFLLKIAMAVEGILILVFAQVFLPRFAVGWDRGGAIPLPVQLLAGATIPIWMAAIVFGRFIYTAL